MALSLDIAVPRRSFELALALEVGPETLALVGPSGAGKTSVLHAVAGLLRPARGRVALDGGTLFDSEEGIDLPPERRRIGLVFQEYALFPHLSVEANVGFGGRERAPELLERFRIAHLAKARPGELSGGERQRVALARALARDPAILLLDEPMAALDAHTRTAVRAELQELLGELGLPTLLVTHDFEDASALADRVGVIADGRLLQLGRPDELVAAPSDAFVAGFTGGNLLHGFARPTREGLTEVVLDGGAVVFSTDRAEGRVGVVVYPWEVSIAHAAAADSALNHVSAPISSLVTLGNRVRVRVGPLVGEVTTASAERLELERGKIVVASFKATGARLVPLRDETHRTPV
ncbi:MAG TPA: ABC transporter ATP-binding protein [Gaiellaceae bacterium]|nr:ABC transporter ATP-binding protein [Gaiellaceae bacterium]